MQFLNTRKNFFLNYALVGGWGIVVFLINLFVGETPLTLLLIFLSLTLIPGYSLARIFQIKVSDDWLDQIILYFAIGFALALASSFIGIILGLTITALVYLYMALIGVSFVVAFCLDLFFHREMAPCEFNWKKIFTLENLRLVLVFVVALSIMLMLVKQGSLIRGGDANYHLATIRKVIGGQPLTPNNLAYTPVQTNIVYMFPLWHVFLGLLVKMTHTNIFAIWKDMAVVLLVPVFLVWYWLSRKIFPTKSLAVLAFILFAIFNFYWGAGWLYTTLPIPHTLSQLLLLPLSVGLALSFIFDSEKINYKLGLILLAFVLLSGAVHLTGYFYYLLILIVFLFSYLIFRFKENDFWSTFKKILLLIIASLGIILPLAVGLELKNHLVTTFLKSFNSQDYSTDIKSTFGEYGLFSKYAYILLPISLFFIKKYRKLVVLLAVLLTAPILYLNFLAKPMTHLLGQVLMKRLFATLEWHFFIWALAIGFLLVLFDRLVNFLAQKNKIWTNLINIILAVLGVILIWLEVQFQFANAIFDQISNDQILGWLDRNYIWLIGLLVLAAIICYFLAIKRPKIDDFFTLREPKNHLTWFLLVFIIGFIFFSPDYKPLRVAFNNNYFQNFFQPSGPSAETVSSSYTKTAGGANEINFINTKIPSKSTFGTNVAYFYLPIMVDQHMPIDDTYAAKKIAMIFDVNVEIGAKLKLLKSLKIDYLFVKRDPDLSGTALDAYPRYFTKIFEDNNFIYRVNRENF